MTVYLSEYHCIKDNYYVYGWNRAEMLERASEYMEEYNQDQIEAEKDPCPSLEFFKECINDFYNELDD